MKICQGCGTEIHRKHRHGGDALKYCSRDCAFAHQKQWRPAHLQPRLRMQKVEQYCLHCGVNVGMDYQPRYCSEGCKWSAYKTRHDDALPRAAQRAAKRRARKLSVFLDDVDRWVVWERDAGFCGICGDAVAFEDMHLEHVIPLSRGGEHSYSNTQPAHAHCNQVKHASTA